MSKTIKMKKILQENYSGTMLGGVVSGAGFHDNISLSNIVKEKYGDVEEKVDVDGLTNEISSYNKLGESIFGESNITKVAERLSWIANQAKSHTLSVQVFLINLVKSLLKLNHYNKEWVLYTKIWVIFLVVIMK